MSKFFTKRLKDQHGHTLLELILTLILLSAVMAVCALLFSSFVKFAKIIRPESNAEKFQTVHLMLEKQIADSPQIIILKNNIYVQDLETSEYLNCYTLSGKLLMRHKVRKTNFSSIKGGTSQFMDGVTAFHLILIDSNHFKLIVSFEKTDGEEESFETILHYPGDVGNIVTR